MNQLSLLDLARKRDPGADDPSLIASISAEIVDELDEQPPVSLEVVASYRDIADIRFEPMPNPASLTPEPDGLVMRLRAGDSWRRQRFGGFHEVGHTFQRGYREGRSLRCENPSPTPRRKVDSESLSDLAAAEMLLPRRHFGLDVEEAEFGFETIVALADLYQASVQATTYRFSDLWPEPMLVVCLEPGLRKGELADPEAELKLRVVSAWPAAGHWPYIPTNKSAEGDGPLNRALGGERIQEAASLDELGIAGPDHLELAARGFTYRRQDGELRQRVLAAYRQPMAG